jgi:hypothetical protein
VAGNVSISGVAEKLAREVGLADVDWQRESGLKQLARNC